ncbi:hypothetical protein MUB24_18305 [Lederbergia sp. NSJ-179]|nr:hypothetical protein [Lederbergia sp. NSJ-179]MCJ7842795.1 hypothetical protein [Lederbergia sp. NSJ-179]
MVLTILIIIAITLLSVEIQLRKANKQNEEMIDLLKKIHGKNNDFPSE